MGVHTYFKSLSDLEHLYRLPGKFKFQSHTVAAHSFKVTKIAQFLGTVEEMNGKNVNWRSLYEKALNHDYAELFTGDIKTPVKYATVELKELFSQVEEQMARKFIEAEFPEEFHDAYLNRFKEGKDNTLEGRILSVADKIDLLYEAYGEILKRNPDPLFFEIYEEALNTILKFQELHSVKYFIHHIMPDMLAEKFMPHSELRDLTERIISRHE
ncbi:YfbR-like 5'-deoxynucleotidase [Domibacillus epiphyticus]|uniref:Hydrolase n=1 Tax=Domibacillus epiphyticus TaxID=1714355 RepID=A0A1V2ABB7_9BACI|nr:YfbR-like 5'-deoxynucleotidase [Domibacillus epiphyticus]OMP68279.1 hydrolase [Domibacillus epiphyticus]